MEAARGKNDVAAAADYMGDGMMMCSDHPYRNNLGGICAFCLQEKLGKLVSSSSPFPFPIPNPHHHNINSPSSSCSSPPSFSSSDVGPSATTNPGKTRYSAFAANPSGNRNPVIASEDSGARRARIPFLLARRKKKKKLPAGPPNHGLPQAVLKRSKSSAGSRSGTGRHFLEVLDDEDEDCYSPRTRRGGGGGGGFWSFLHPSASSSSSSKSGVSRKGEKPSFSSGGGDSKIETLTSLEESPCVVNGTGNQFPVFERKVSRSRSVGCGSRSFSGDFFERISTGLGDCTLRRVESHREGHNNNRTPKQPGQPHHQQTQKMYKCGGIFGGFMMISAPSSASSYWVSSSTNADDHHQHEYEHHQVPRKSSALANGGSSRARSWSWAFASPMRAFAKPSKDQKREINIIRDGSGKNSAPNLSAIPSLLTVGG